MIAIQVAAGIVLAYVIIVNQRRLLRFSGWLLSAILIIGAIAAIGAGSSLALGALGPYWPKIWSATKLALGMCVILPCWFTGAYGLILLFRRIFRTSRPDLSGEGNAPFIILVAFAMLNTLIMWLVGWPLLEFTVAGRWYDSIDMWSRSSGYDDGAVVTMHAALSLWTMIPVAILAKLSPRPADDADDVGTVDAIAIELDADTR